MSLRLARNTISAARSDPQLSEFVARQDPAEVERIGATASAKAEQLRRFIGPRLMERLGLKGANKGGGTWSYSDPSGDTPAAVMVDYGGMSQLRYWVRPVPVGQVRGAMLSLEAAFGLIQSWDWITEAGAEDAAELFTDCVAWCFEVPARAAAAIAAD
jgi:hypothetical protein